MVLELAAIRLSIMSSEIDLAIESILAKDSDHSPSGNNDGTCSNAIASAASSALSANLLDDYANSLFKRREVQQQSILDNPEDDFLLPDSKNTSFHDFQGTFASISGLSQKSNYQDWPLSTATNSNVDDSNDPQPCEYVDATIQRLFCGKSDANLSTLDHCYDKDEKGLSLPQILTDRTFVRSDQDSNNNKTFGRRFDLSLDFSCRQPMHSPTTHFLSRPASKGSSGGESPLDLWLTEFANTNFVEEAIMEVVFDVHRSAKCGLMFLRTMSSQNKEKYKICCSETAERDTESAHRPLTDIFGHNLAAGIAAFFSNNKSKSAQQIECVCPECNQTTAACRFAPHLEKCMGMGRNSSRVARRRLAAVSSSASLGSALCPSGPFKNSSSSSQQRPVDFAGEPSLSRSTRSAANRAQKSTNSNCSGQKRPTAKVWGQRLKVWIGDDDDDEDVEEESLRNRVVVKGDVDYAVDEEEDYVNDEDAESGGSSAYSNNSTSNERSDDDWTGNRRAKPTKSTAKKRGSVGSRRKKLKTVGGGSKKKPISASRSHDNLTPTSCIAPASSSLPSSKDVTSVNCFHLDSGSTMTTLPFFRVSNDAPNDPSQSFLSSVIDGESLASSEVVDVQQSKAMLQYYNKKVTLSDPTDGVPSPDF